MRRQLTYCWYVSGVELLVAEVFFVVVDDELTAGVSESSHTARLGYGAARTGTPVTTSPTADRSVPCTGILKKKQNSQNSKHDDSEEEVIYHTMTRIPWFAF